MMINLLIGGEPSGSTRFENVRVGDQVVLSDGETGTVTEVLPDRGVRVRCQRRAPHMTYMDTVFLRPEEITLSIRTDDTRSPSVLPLAHRATAAKHPKLRDATQIDVRAWHEALRANAQARRERDLKRAEIIELYGECTGLTFRDFLLRGPRVEGISKEAWPEVALFLFPGIHDE